VYRATNPNQSPRDMCKGTVMREPMKRTPSEWSDIKSTG
jgi:hypothetical protein